MIRSCENCSEAYDEEESDSGLPREFCSSVCEDEAEEATCENCGYAYVDTSDSEFCCEECEAEYYEEEE